MLSVRVHSASKCQRQELGRSWDSLWGFLESVILVVKNPATSRYRRYKRLRFSSWGASFLTQTVKNLPAVQETRVQSLGWEEPLEKAVVTHSSILAWKISWTEESGGL